MPKELNDIEKELNDIEKKKITHFFYLLHAYLSAVNNRVKNEKFSKGLQNLEDFVGAVNNYEISKFFKEEVSANSIKIKDAGTTTRIAANNKDSLELSLEQDCKEIIGDVLYEEVKREIENHDKNGQSNISETIKKIEEKTDCKYGNPLDEPNESFSIDDYFLEMSITYAEISNALSKTIDDLTIMLEKLEERIEKLVILKSTNDTDSSIETSTVPASIPSADADKAPVKNDVPAKQETKTTVVDKPKQTVVDRPKQSIEDIELGVGYDDEFDYDDEYADLDAKTSSDAYDDEIVEVTPEEKGDNPSAVIDGFFNDDDDKPTQPSKKATEDNEDMPQGVKL